MSRLKNCRGVMCHKEKLTGGLKNDTKNLVNFHASSFGLLLSIAFNVSAKKVELPLTTLKRNPNFEEKLSFCLKNDMRNLVNFNTNSGKSENLHYDGLLLSKVCNV